MNTIETDRLILRGWKESDYLDLYEFISDDRVAQNTGYKAIKDLQASKHIIRTCILHSQSYAIELKSEKKVIGSIGIDDIAMDKELLHLKQRYIGYTINSKYWGNGYATEAVKFLIRYLFEELNLDLVWSSHYDFNTKSKRVLEKSGLEYKYSREVMLKALGNKTASEMFYALQKDGRAMLDVIPTEEQVQALLGNKVIEAWKELNSFIESHYDFVPIWDDGGKYGTWEVKYRKTGKTLCAFYAKDGHFTVLIVFGKAEREKFELSQKEFTTEIIDIYNNTRQYHDGKWLWIKVMDISLVEDIKRLIIIKKKLKTKQLI